MSDIKFDGNKLFYARKKKKLSQTKLALKVGVTRQSIYLWESNQSVPDIEKVTRLCKVLEIEVSELVEGSQTEIFESEKEISQNTNSNNTEIGKKNILLKFIIILVFIVGCIYVMYSTVKFVRLSKILNKWNELDKIDNYYVKIQEYLVNENNEDMVSESLFYDKYYHNGILKIVVKDRKDNEIKGITICDYNNGKKYIIYEDTKTYRIEKIENDKNNKLTSDFYLSFKFKDNSIFMNYLTCFNFDFNILKKQEYQIIFKDKFKERINQDNYLLEYEETNESNRRKYKRYYKIELNSSKDFEVNLDDYTEITE